MAVPQEKDGEAMLQIAEERSLETSSLKLDTHGLPLVPQPSDRKDDPLASSYSFPGQIVRF